MTTHERQMAALFVALFACALPEPFALAADPPKPQDKAKLAATGPAQADEDFAFQGRVPWPRGASRRIAAA